MSTANALRTLRTCLRAARPLAHANIAPPLLFGQALAYRLEGVFSWKALAFAQLFGVVDHLFIVFANDYADRHADSGARTWLSGGSGVIAEERVRPRTLALAAAVSGAALLALGLSFSGAAFGLAAAALALLALYSYPPARLSYRGHGEWLQGLGVGLVLPWVGYHAQTGDALPPFAPLAGLVLLAAAGNIVTAAPDLRDDTRAEKRTLPVRVGIERAARAAEALTLLGVALTLALAPIGDAARAALFVAALVPLAAAAATEPERRVMRWAVGVAASQQIAVLGVALAMISGR